MKTSLSLVITVGLLVCLTQHVSGGSICAGSEDGMMGNVVGLPCMYTFSYGENGDADERCMVVNCENVVGAVIRCSSESAQAKWDLLKIEPLCPGKPEPEMTTLQPPV